ncbi:MAG: S8 family serine peptidase, partial [Firmicutes bacterium]|nr:S8 family serine peptidase [Bacillota bacterium]
MKITKNKIRKTIILSLVIIFMLMTVAATPTNHHYYVATNEQVAAKQIDSNIVTATQQPRHSRTTTLEDNFIDNVVGIILTYDATFSGHIYTVRDFREIGAVYVEDLTARTIEIVQAQKAAEQSGALKVMQEQVYNYRTQVTADSFMRLEYKSLNEQLFSNQQFSTYYDIIPFVERNLLFDTQQFRRSILITLAQNCKRNVLEVVQILEQRKDVFEAFVDYIIPTRERIMLDTVNSTIIEPTADFLDEGWHIEAIGIDKAWGFTTGSRNVRVGIIDDGIFANHPDLQGLVCPVLSKSVCTVYSDPLWTIRQGTTYFRQDHGTGVAGIIATNGIGVVGVNRNITLVALRSNFGRMILDEVSPYARYSGNERLVIHATENAVDIINFSQLATNNHPGFVNAVRQFPGLFVAGAGNGYLENKIPIDNFYANALSNNNFPNLITVGNVFLFDGNWYKFGESNYCSRNSTVQIWAPGYRILSTTAREGSYLYQFERGTSFATPFISGVAALMLSVNPSLSAVQLRNTIINNADTITIDTPSAGRMQVQRLNAHRAVAAVALETLPLSGGIVIGRLTPVPSFTLPQNSNLVIPDRIAPFWQSQPIQQDVVAIGSNAFINNTQIARVTLPETLRTIGMSAFANNVNLTSVILPSSLERIEANAFANNPNLRTIDINRANSVMQIMSNSFAGSNNIQ